MLQTLSKTLLNEPCLCSKHSKDESVLKGLKKLLCFISSWGLMLGKNTSFMPISSGLI